ncbi:MAG: ABC transporter substrate-binding protein [Hyphomonas sp.]|nr:ABC transporter substrate-binding protein [Hyphomonas sp.]
MFRALFAATALGLVALPALAGPEAEAVIEGAARSITDPSQGRETLRESMDLKTVANFTLGKYARRVSAADRDRFAEAFEAYLLESFEEQSDKFRNAEIRVIGSKDRTPTDSIVETRVLRPGEQAQTVRWRVIEKQGQWRVVDVEVLGLWLAIEQRAQIAAIMDRPRATIEDAIRALDS